jgi:hypothetical protein
MDIDDVGPDRNRLHDLVKLTWDEARSDGTTVTDERIAAAGPYSVEQIREHLLAMQGDLYEVSDAGGTLQVTSVR